MDVSFIIHLPCLYLTDDDLDIENIYEDFLLEEVRYLRDNVYPELASHTLSLIEKRLGYLPRKSLTIHYEPDLRLYYQRYISGQCCLNELYYRTDELLKHMRTEDLKPDLSIFNAPETCKQLSKHYQSYLPEAHARITKIMEIETPLEHSAAAALWLCQILARDDIQLPDHISPYDYRAMTSIQYREMWIKEGERAADSSPLAFSKSIE